MLEISDRHDSWTCKMWFISSWSRTSRHLRGSKLPPTIIGLGDQCQFRCLYCRQAESCLRWTQMKNSVLKWCRSHPAVAATSDPKCSKMSHLWGCPELTILCILWISPHREGLGLASKPSFNTEAFAEISEQTKQVPFSTSPAYTYGTEDSKKMQRWHPVPVSVTVQQSQHLFGTEV